MVLLFLLFGEGSIKKSSPNKSISVSESECELDDSGVRARGGDSSGEVSELP